MKEGTYTVILRAEPESGYTVLVPALPGCLTCGDPMAEALERAEEALLCYILDMRELGKPVPEEGPEISLPAEELTGALLVYRVSPKREAAEIA